MSEGAQPNALTIAISAIGLTISVLAFLRPEINSVLRKWRNRIHLSLAPRLEIGYSDFGPTLGIFGSISAIHYDQIVSNIALKLTKRRNRAEHVFSWFAFRSSTFAVHDQARMEVEIAAAFTLKTSEARKINIIFQDLATREEIVPRLLNLRRVFSEFVQSAPRNQDAAAGLTAKFQSAHQAEFLDTFHLLQKKNYWDAGDYDLAVEIRTHDPEKAFVYNFTFSISDEEVKTLELNCLVNMQVACFEQRPFNFAYVKLVPH